MDRFINAKVAFQFDCRFPLPLLVFEAAAGDAVNVVRFESRRFVHGGNFLSGSVIILSVQQSDAVICDDEIIRSNLPLLRRTRFKIDEFDFENRAPWHLYYTR